MANRDCILSHWGLPIFIFMGLWTKHNLINGPTSGKHLLQTGNKFNRVQGRNYHSYFLPEKFI